MNDPLARPFVVEAFFDDPEPARAAVLALEGKGIDADYIHVVSPDAVPTADQVRTGEEAMAGNVGRRAFAGAVIGAVLGAVILTAVLLLLDVGETGTAVIVGVLVGVIGGGALGGLWNVARRLPVNEEAFDTRFIDPMDDAPVRVEVRLADKADADAAAEALWELHPRRVESRKG